MRYYLLAGLLVALSLCSVVEANGGFGTSVSVRAGVFGGRVFGRRQVIVQRNVIVQPRFRQRVLVQQVHAVPVVVQQHYVAPLYVQPQGVLVQDFGVSGGCASGACPTQSGFVQNEFHQSHSSHFGF